MPFMPAAAAPILPAALRLGAVHLTVADLTRAVAWYEQALGLRVHRHDPEENGVGVGPPPPHAVGLRTWTVELPTPADVDALHARLDATGHAVEPVERGFVLRDSWQTAMTVVTTA